MKTLIQIFFRTPGTRPFLVLACLLLAGVAEAFSIGALLPLAANLSGGASGGSGLTASIATFAQWLGIEASIGNLVLAVTGFMVLKAALAFTALSYAGVSAARVAISLRRRLIEAVFGARWSFFANQRGGAIATVIASDAGRAGDAYLISAQAFAFAIQGLAYAVLALALNWRVALLGFAASALLALVMGRLIQAAKRAGYKQTDRTAALTVHMVDLFSNIKPLRAMQRHQPMLADVTRILGRLKRALVNRELAKAGLIQGGDALVALLVGAGLYAASAFTTLTFAEMIVGGVVFFQVISVVSKLQRVLQQAAQVESAYIRTGELIAEAEASAEPNPGRAAPDPAQTIRFRVVSFAHGDFPVVRGASFDIPPGKITVLSGPSGAGKTTLIDLLIGLHRPQAGDILIGAMPLGDTDLTAWRRMIGYVPQELNLFHASVRDNIRLGDEAIGDGAIHAALALAGAADFIAELPSGLDTDMGEMGAKFSGGQRQRISLARALVSQPKLLILDEVTSALDPRTEAEIVANIAALSGRYTIVAITHRPAWTAVADRLYRVSAGKVTADAKRSSGKRKS